MSGHIGGAEAGLSIWARIAAAMALFFAIEIAISFAIAFYGTPEPHNAPLWLAPVLSIALLFFRGSRARQGAAAVMTVLIVPAAIASEMLAHAFGTCLH